jgi:dihydrolipoamide dehydrogenase
VDISIVPSCIYTSPEIASVGLSSDEAKEKGLDVISKKYPMSANGKTVLSLQERGFIKVIADKETGRILGAQMMCARATDMISQFAQAVANGLTLKDMSKVIYPHPTFSEGIGEAVR